MQDRRYRTLKNVVADCFNKTMIIAKNVIVAPMSISDAIEADLKRAKQKQVRYPKGYRDFTLDDEKLQNELNNRIDTLRNKNVRNLIELYVKQIVKETLDKDNYLIGFNQAYPHAIERINYERAVGLLDDFYLPVDKSANDDDKRH